MAPLMISSSQKFHLHPAPCVKKPPTTGAMTGPRKLAAVKRANGTDLSACTHRSVREPPELVTVGEPKKPERKRKTNRLAMLGARAQASCINVKRQSVIR